MEKGQSQRNANKGMRCFVSGRSFAALVVPILLSMLVFNRFKKKKKSAEKESIEGASSPSSFHPTPAGEDSDRYEVFLSFDGSDTRKEFIDHLYDKLVAAGICVFNHNSIPIGEEFGSLHLDAITRSEISIPIISENYASSKWCLRQLIHIMDHNKSKSRLVLPIFYNVYPSDVCYLQGSLWDEMDIKALEKVSRLNGWTYEEYAIGHEGELVEQVVAAVLKELPENFRLLVPKEVVGLDGHLKKIMKWTDIPSVDARMIGIYGMGGIGKTTLAKCLYNQLSNKFDHVSFLSDVRETAHLHKIEYLQSRLISEVLHDNIPVSTVDEGTDIIKSKLSGKKVLILLDDIDDNAQLDALAGERNWFASGSIIIVTTRYKAVLNQSKFGVDHEHQMSEIDVENSLVLFNDHALRKDIRPQRFVRVSRDIVSTMGGLPLALVVIGSHLYEKSTELWEDLLMELKEKPYKNVKETLRISYDALLDEHKEIFLDIACFFMVKESEVAMYMGDGCGSHASNGIEELKLRGLIKIEDDGELKMHDELRNLGWNIICRGQLPKKYSALWADEEAFRGLTGEKGTTMTEAFCRDEFCGYPFLDYGSSIHLQADRDGQFEKLQRLRFLRLRDPTSSGDLNEFFSEVRWLRWIRIELNPSFSATNLHLPKLLVLHLSHSSITEDWKGWSSITAAKRLKVLRLEHFDSLRCTPDLSALTDLQILVFKNCERLEQVHASIGKVKSLASLDLSGCGNLEELPGEVGELEELKEVILDSTGIMEIPISIGSLRILEKLSARHCRSLREIPSTIGDLQNLQHLDISESPIEKLPSDIGRLQKLRRLLLNSCRRLSGEISIGDLSSLEILEITEALISNLLDIWNLSSLQHLTLWGCHNLYMLLELPFGLKYLKASYQGPRLPDFSCLIHLEEVVLSWKRST